MAMFKLNRPVVLEDRTVSEFEVPGIDDLTLDDVIHLSELDGGDIRAMAETLAEVAHIEPQVLGKMSFADVQRLIAEVVRPLQEVPGETPSASPPISPRSSRRT